MSGPPLFEEFSSLQAIPWLPLAHVPTPVQQVVIDGRWPCWVKRDDLTHDSYGGNKVRKLEFLLARARQLGATRLITAGAAGSHHALATAVFGRALGFDVSLVLFPQPLTEHVREVLLTDAALGAELRFTSRMTLVPAALAAARLAHWRERRLSIKPGGSDEIGTLGYVNALVELKRQIEQGLLPAPEVVVLAAGTLGTTAGIAVGRELLGLSFDIVATRITSRLVTNEQSLHALIRDTCRLLERHGVPVSAERACQRLRLSHDQVGPGYGQATADSEQALRTFQEIGLALDNTYTAKAAADLLDLFAGGEQRRVLFWHTLSAAMPAVALPPVDALPAPFREYLGR